MVEGRICPSCGSPIPPDAPSGGLCPKCLLMQGFVSQDPTQGALSDVRRAAPSPADLAPLFPQLEILDLIGQGGMGAVYRARQKNLDRLVALKILAVGHERGPAFSERFVREARTLARLNHPNIVGIHDFGETGGLYYFVMEYVDGASLREVLQSGRLSPRQALAIIPRICEALQYAHDEGIVHRDIKPENILLDEKGRVKIADFGLAKLILKQRTDVTLTEPGMVMGTPAYMAPEQIERPGQVDHRADIFSLGVVFYEMLTGELPLGRFPSPSQKVEVDVRLDDVVLRTLEKEPRRRYQHASEVKTDVESIEAGGRAAAAAPQPVVPATAPPVASPAIAAATAAGLLGASPTPAPPPPTPPPDRSAASAGAAAPTTPPPAPPFAAQEPPPPSSGSAAEPPLAKGAAPSEGSESPRRPKGVTWVAVYAFFSAAFFLGFPFGGIGFGGAFDDSIHVPFLLRATLATWAILTGFGLLSLKRWARTSGIVLAIVGLSDVPVWTVASIFVLIYLLRRRIKALFGRGEGPLVVSLADAPAAEKALGKVTDVLSAVEDRIRTGLRGSRKRDRS